MYMFTVKEIAQEVERAERSRMGGGSISSKKGSTPSSLSASLSSSTSGQSLPLPVSYMYMQSFVQDFFLGGGERGCEILIILWLLTRVVLGHAPPFKIYNHWDCFWWLLMLIMKLLLVVAFQEICVILIPPLAASVIKEELRVWHIWDERSVW